MFPTSTRFRQAVSQGAKTGATMVTTLEVREAGRTILTPQFLIRDGSVTADLTAANWRRCDITFADLTGSLIPQTARDLFSPVSGRELVPRRGFRFPDGTVETVPLGIMKITSAHVVEDDKGVVITASGTDRSIFFSNNKWTEPFMMVPNDLAEFMAGILIDRALPWMHGMTPRLIIDTGFTSGFNSTGPVTYNPGDDPWSQVQQIAASIGYYAGFNLDGQFINAAIPDPSLLGGSSVWTINDTDHRTARKADTDYSDQDAFNGVVAVGQNNFGLTPPRGVVWDDDPASATYYLGPTGKKPYFRPPDPLLFTAEQCVVAARGDLNKHIGISQTVEIDQFVNPALDLLDVMTLDLPRSKLKSVYMVQRITTPLTVDRSQQVRMSERRIV